MLREQDGETIVGKFFARCAETPDRVAVLVKSAGEFRPLTWQQLESATAGVMAGLLEQGVLPGDRVATVSENRWEWLIVDMAVQALGGIHVPLHSALSAEQTTWEIAHSRPRVTFLSNAVQVNKLANAAGLPSDSQFVTFDREPSQLAGRPLPSINDWLGDYIAWENQIGQLPQRDYTLIHRKALARRAFVRPDDIATIIYTSGTTGEPKGVMLTQRNLASNALGIVEAFGSKVHYRRLNILPLSHIYARTCDWYVSIVAGTEMALAESRESVIADIQLTRPTVINGVPYFFDKLRRVLEEKGLAKQPGALAGLLGGRIELCNSGGAALPDHVAEFYESQGVILRQGYGLTETSPVITLSTETVQRPVASGKVIPGVEVRIADDGEILTRGPHVMAGYYRDEAATADAIKDGWFYTGDLGRLDEDGFLFITGRKKELIVTSLGKNVAPTLIEGLLTADPLILQAMVIGDGRNYLAALIVPNPETLHAFIADQKVALKSPAEALTHSAIITEYDRRIRERLAGLSSHEQIRRFLLLPCGFTPEQGELTPKLSLRREVIAAHYRTEIASLYDRH